MQKATHKNRLKHRAHTHTGKQETPEGLLITNQGCYGNTNKGNRRGEHRKNRNTST